MVVRPFGQKLAWHSIIEAKYSNNHLDVARRCHRWIEIHSTLESSWAPQLFSDVALSHKHDTLQPYYLTSRSCFIS
jgi:hypothetical protein